MPRLRDEFDALFPPRRDWPRPRDESALFALVWSELSRSRTPKADWQLRLTRAVEEIRRRALDGPPDLNRPRIHLREKSTGVYRATTVYEIADRIILSQVTRYMTRAFEGIFADNVYGGLSTQSGEARSHHDAFKALRAYRAKHGADRLWVAECDLRGFFDCLHGHRVRLALWKAHQRLKAWGAPLDPRALAIFDSFLNSYSHGTVALPDAKEWLARHDPAGHLDTYERELAEIWEPIPPTSLGVAQGAALSQLIANLVLDPADHAVLGEDHDSDLFYARYVDDTIIVHPDRSACERAFERYCDAVSALRLPIHPPQEVRQYNAGFWTGKSRLPYAWEKSGTTPASVPWVSFVGYQLRHDGLGRIRPSSIAKHLRRQAEEADTLLSLLSAHSRLGTPGLDPDAVLRRLASRLATIAIGRRAAREDRPSGWCSGFLALRGRPLIRAQLRRLDRGRGRQIARVRQWMEARGLKVRGTPPPALEQSYERQFVADESRVAAHAGPP
ncbi:MAG: reverse transcriptase domain-containing protein [Myxococcaceae bacterium]